jgi:hypothetical protein
MKKRTLIAAMGLALAGLLGGTLAQAAQARAQDLGYWRPADSMAAAITGDITIRPSELTIYFITYSLAPIRALKPAEVSAAFDVVADPGISGMLYRLKVPAAQRFAHKNTLCGGEETQWMATYVTGKTLEVALFSGDEIPVFTFEAMQGSQARCGVFTYKR